MRCHTPSCWNKGRYSVWVSKDIGFQNIVRHEDAPPNADIIGFCAQCWLHLLACRVLEGRMSFPEENEVMSLAEWVKWMEKFDPEPEIPKLEYLDEAHAVYQRRALMQEPR